jgi:hypothetical protein
MAQGYALSPGVLIDNSTIVFNSKGQLQAIAAAAEVVAPIILSGGKYALAYDNTTLNLNGSNQLELNLANANTWTALQTFNGFISIPANSAAVTGVEFANYTDGTLGASIAANSSGYTYSGADEFDIFGSTKSTANTLQATVVVQPDQIGTNFLAMVGDSTTVAGNTQLVAGGNVEIDYGGTSLNSTSTFTLAQGTSRTAIVSATVGTSPKFTITAAGGITLNATSGGVINNGFFAYVNNATSGADLSIYGNAATVTSGSNVETVSIYTEGGEKVGVEMTGTTTSASISFQSTVSTDDAIDFHVGAATNKTLSLGDAAGHPNKVTTVANTLDDGSGNQFNNATQTTLTGTTAGTIVWSEPQQGSAYKKFVGYANGYENTTATAQTITFPTAFVNAPIILGNSTGMTLTAITTTLTLPASMSATATGWIIIEGY